MLTAVAVVAIAGVVAAAVIAGKPRPATVPVTEAMAYTATMNASSADVYAICAITSGNHKSDMTITESGAVSWSANQGETAMKMTTGGRQLMTARQIIDGRKTYSKIFLKGLSASALARFPGLAGWSEETWTGASRISEARFWMGSIRLTTAPSSRCLAWASAPRRSSSKLNGCLAPVSLASTTGSTPRICSASFVLLLPHCGSRVPRPAHPVK